MTNAQPGWYPDPAGDTGKLRYWDGTQWTDHLAEPQPAPGTADATLGAQAAPAQNGADPNAAQSGGPSFVTPPRPTTPPSYTTASFVGAVPYDAPASSGPAYASGTVEAPYAPAEEDRTLRLVITNEEFMTSRQIAWHRPIILIPMVFHLSALRF